MDDSHPQHGGRRGGGHPLDFEKKFIRAEVVNWKSLVDLGGYPEFAKKVSCASKAKNI